MSEWLPELSELLRIPSISAQPEHGADVRRTAEWLCDFVRGAGGEADVVDWQGETLVVGEIRASRDPDGAPTVICYGHFDVQPPDPLELWESDPFEPEIRGERLYARGVADDKGQLYLLFAGARELAQAGELPVNVRFICDGEEESGGDSIVEYTAADERGADAAIIFDTGMIRERMPAFNMVVRGMAYFHLELTTGDHDLHSGMYGSAAMNAAHALIRTLDAVIAVDGRLPEPLRQGIVPPTEAELAEWSRLPSGAEELALQQVQPADARAAEEFYIRTGAEPSLEVNGIDSGSAHAQKTVLPIRASANVSIRLVPGQDPAVIAAAFEQLVRVAVPAGATLDVQLQAASPAGVVPADAPAIRLGQDAFERVLGVRPVLMRTGGTLPIVNAFSSREIPVIVTGFSLPDANIHAPNENLPAEYIPLGIETARALFGALGEL